MNKKYYTAGFFYNPRSGKVLLIRSSKNTNDQSPKWTIFEGINDIARQPSVAFRELVLKKTRLKLPKESIRELYDYVNNEDNLNRYAFYMHAKFFKNSKRPNREIEFQWFSFKDTSKLGLSANTKQDLTFFQREMNAKKISNPKNKYKQNPKTKTDLKTKRIVAKNQKRAIGQKPLTIIPLQSPISKIIKRFL